jgi:hypothetical protein
MGDDMEQVRWLGEHVDIVRRDVGSDNLSLWRFDYDRDLGAEEVSGMEPSGADERVEEIFAYVGKAPGIEDEMIPGVMVRGQPLMLTGTSIDIVRETLMPFANQIRNAGQKLNLRRFVRGEKVEEPRRTALNA